MIKCGIIIVKMKKTFDYFIKLSSNRKYDFKIEYYNNGWKYDFKTELIFSHPRLSPVIALVLLSWIVIVRIIIKLNIKMKVRIWILRSWVFDFCLFKNSKQIPWHLKIFHDLINVRYSENSLCLMTTTLTYHAKTSLIRVTKIQHTNLEIQIKEKSPLPLLILFNLLQTVNHLYIGITHHLRLQPKLSPEL